jgi:hypothetical protein
MEQETATAGELLRRSFELARSMGTKAGVALAVLTAIDVISDFGSGSGLIGLLGIVSLVFQLWITRTLLQELGLSEQDDRRLRFWAAVGLGILSSLGIGLGLVLLIVPGVILFARWSIALPVLLAEGTGITEALGRSWEETEGRVMPIIVTFLCIYLPMAIALILTGAFDQSPGGVRLGLSIGSNLIANAALVLGWHAAVAIYAERKVTGRLAQVFA